MDIGSNGEVLSAKIFFDAIHNMNNSGTKDHYGICEERYFNNEGKPCVRATIYKSSGNLQTEVQARQSERSSRVKWENLPKSVKTT